MDWGILATDIDVQQEYFYEYSPYYTKKESMVYSPQTSRTTTFSPTSVQDITYAPQYIIGSPEATATTKKAGASAQPSISIIPSQTVSPSQTDIYGKSYQDAPLKVEQPSGIMSGVTGIFAIGLLAVGGIIALKVIMKAPKSKTGLIKKVIT